MPVAERYELDHLLHNGSSTLVYRARERRTGASVIIKMARQGMQTARLRSEHDILQKLRIPGVVQARGLDVEGDEVALVLEDLGGSTLGARLAGGALPLSDVLRIASELAETLGRIHRCHVIHRDINPSNILLSGDGRALIFDFDLATRLPREVQSVRSLNHLAGTLPYISPEQTGRVNRAVDHRTDFYSLGATLYTMLVGETPFRTRDPMELIHCHIAKAVVPPSEVDPGVPPVVSSICLKLLSKSAEARYQSAFGLRADFEACRRGLAEALRIEPFVLGQDDFSERFHLPQRLYGREREVAALEQAFAWTQQGKAALVVVTGRSGIGKSSLVQELGRSLLPHGGYSVAGKFDLLKRDIPYSGLLQALSELIRMLLAEPEEVLSTFRQRILDALGGAGRVLTDVLGELVSVIGPQPPVPELGATEGRSRFRLVFERFIRVFTQHGHPLVVFLDDLQWADAATLDLLPILLADGRAGALLLLGAYRDDEVAAPHPLLSSLEAVEAAGCSLTRIEVGPLALDDVRRLVADALLITGEAASPLAELLFRRTGGSPLFIGELLSSLNRDGLIESDPAGRRWAFDLGQIERAPVTESIGQLVSARTAALREGTREMLQLAAVLGNEFDLRTLSVFAERSASDTKAALEEALQEELILSLGRREADAYRFFHDRVQQAVYASIPEDRLVDLHYRAGQKLRDDRRHGGGDEWLFIVLNHLNFAAARIVDPREREELARMNHAAARRAVASGAFSSAGSHYAASVRFLGEAAWSHHHDLMFALHQGLAECAYASSDHPATERLFDLLLQRARTDVERVQVYERITNYELHLARYQKALGAALKALDILGMSLPPEPSPALVMVELLKTKRALRGRAPAELLNLPAATAPRVELTHRVLIETTMVAFFTSPVLNAILTLRTVQHSLREGYSCYSAEAFGFYGLMLIALFGAHAEGEAFGRLAMALVERFPNTAVECRVKNSYGYFGHVWRNPARLGLAHLDSALQGSFLVGDVLVAGYILFNRALLLAITGEPLDALREKCEEYLDFARKAKHDFAETILTGLQHAAMALQGQTSALGSYDAVGFDEARYVAELMGKSSQMDLAHYWVFKRMVLYILDRQGEILVAPESYGKSVKKEIETSPLPVLVEHHLYDALFWAWVAEREGGVARQRALLKIRVHLRKLEKCAASAPMNFLHKQLLVGAELARLTRNDQLALGMYQEAIERAHQRKALSDAAVAHELLSKHYRARGLDDAATAELAKARQVYLRWGARAKVALIDAAYPGLAGRVKEDRSEGATSRTSDESAMSGLLDFPSMLKSSQALSGEVDLEKLLLRLMSIIAENAGAARGILALFRDDALHVAAEFDAQRGARLPEHRVSLKQADGLSHAIVNYVLRTRQSVILGDAGREGEFTTDPYVVERDPRAILCMPLLHKGDIQGILYLENNLVAGAFTAERAEFLSVLCTQTAISIDNALLYGDLEKKVVERTVALEEAQRRLVQLEKEATEIQMAGGFAHEMRNALAGARLTLSTVCAEGKPTACEGNIETLAALYGKLRSHIPNDLHADVAVGLRKISGSEQKIDRVLKVLDTALVRGLGITRMILEYAELGRTQPGRSQVSMQLLMSTITQEMAIDLERHGISIDVDVPATCSIAGDELHFHSILKNLVLNARDALLESSDGERSRRISLRAVEHAGHLVLTVEDTGPGIPAEMHEKIFDPFFSTKPNVGTGLGLGFARKLATLYGGTIELESSPPRGATFRVILPQRRADLAFPV